MISRKSAKLIADAYTQHFKSSRATFNTSLNRSVYDLKEEEINTFLYEREYEQRFLYLMRGVVSNDVRLVKAIMQLHTGETISSAYNSVSLAKSQELGQQLLKKLAEDMFKLYDSLPFKDLDVMAANSRWDRILSVAATTIKRPADNTLKQLKAQLEIDGYIYKDGVLYAIESSVIDVQAEQSYLDQLIDSANLADPATIKHHIQLAEDDYMNDRWSNSIGNSRHFLEAILGQVLERVSIKLNRNLHPNVYKNATTTREHLEREGLISTDEKDTFKQIYGLLSNTGGHAYIAQKDQARLMWHLALTCSQFMLLRYEGFVRAHP